MKTNYVIAGDYVDWKFLSFSAYGTTACQIQQEGFFFVQDKVLINKSTVESFNVIDKNDKNSYSLMYGALGKKNEYTVEIIFKNGKKSLIVMDSNAYKNMLKYLY